MSQSGLILYFSFIDYADTVDATATVDDTLGLNMTYGNDFSVLMDMPGM